MQQLLSGPWPVRITWLLLPLCVGPALGDALAGSSRAIEVIGAVLAWGTWAKVLVAVLIPRTVGLTALRIVAPLGLVVSVWAGLVGDRGGADVVAVAWAALTAVAAFAPATGDAFVNGSSYGDERRMPLRVPASLLLAPLPLTWAAAVAAPVAAPLLLGARQWVAGGIVVVLGTPAAAVAIRALHGLSRRWVVFVPAGLVLHDHQALVDPVLFPRPSIRHLGPAPADPSDAYDLTQGALGLALELDLVEPLDIGPRRANRSLELERVGAVLFTPTRPGELLQEAARRRIAVG
ncbi:MAG TPA: hypothetical protein VFV32_10355 [Acidimicrobiales bacterium]|nr:hypothetical protein [Acidimicrobiales bacterium]